MLKLYYTFQKTASHPFLFHVLETFHGIPAQDKTLLYGERGKPFLEGNPVHFSLTHTEGLTAVAVSDRPVGLDAECVSRPIPAAIFNRLSPVEKAECADAEAFFGHWTVKESYVKFLGQSIVEQYSRLTFTRGILTEDGNPVPVRLFRGTFAENHFVWCVCSGWNERVEPLELRLPENFTLL